MSKSSTSKTSKTDWKRVDALRDEDIDLSDNPEVTPEMFAKAIVRRGLISAPPKEQVTLRLDIDVLRWFRSQGKGYQSKINALLRAYMEARSGK
ncbi:MAG: BrnA antitoxin family protein [Gammaproteobacteria bacterium]